MSSPGHLTERTVTSVLHALWKRPESTLQSLLRDTLAPQPDVLSALEVLQRRRCLIERTPSSIRLVSTGLPCWSDILEHEATTANRAIGRRVMVFLKTASTNDIAWQCAAGNVEDTHGLVVVADEQTAGRGRLGHTWTARPEQSILLSVLLQRLPEPANTSPGAPAAPAIDRLTLLAGLAAATALEAALAQAGVPAPRIDIKWPNDLLIAGKKVAGILVERRPSPQSSASLARPMPTVIGIGINITQAVIDFPPDIAPRATSLYAATGKMLDRLRVASLLLQQLERYCLDPTLTDAWIDDWKSRCAMLGTRIHVRTATPGNPQLAPLAGQVLDVAPLHGLVLRDDHGSTHFLSAATTTLQP
jgi:BirA family biotin operon repressor/biotin-[acetyl-CoA-carboxylase] ligase